MRDCDEPSERLGGRRVVEAARASTARRRTVARSEQPWAPQPARPGRRCCRGGHRRRHRSAWVSQSVDAAVERRGRVRSSVAEASSPQASAATSVTVSTSSSVNRPSRPSTTGVGAPLRSARTRTFGTGRFGTSLPIGRPRQRHVAGRWGQDPRVHRPGRQATSGSTPGGDARRHRAPQPEPLVRTMARTSTTVSGRRR